MTVLVFCIFLSVAGINTPRKFRTSLHYLRQLLTESSTHQDSADERDSGVRTSSEPASPLASEGENENAFGAARLTAQLRSLPVTSTDTGSEHRFVYMQGVQHASPVILTGKFRFLQKR